MKTRPQLSVTLDPEGPSQQNKPIKNKYMKS